MKTENKNKKTDLNQLIGDIKKTKNLNLNKMLILLDKYNLMHQSDINIYIKDNIDEILDDINYTPEIDINDFAPDRDF